VALKFIPVSDIEKAVILDNEAGVISIKNLEFENTSTNTGTAISASEVLVIDSAISVF